MISRFTTQLIRNNRKIRIQHNSQILSYSFTFYNTVVKIKGDDSVGNTFSYCHANGFLKVEF